MVLSSGLIYTLWDSKKVKRERKGAESSFEKNNGWKDPKFEKIQDVKKQEIQQTPSRINLERPILRYIIIKPLKVKKKLNLGSIKRKELCVQGILNKITSRLVRRKLAGQKTVGW